MQRVKRRERRRRQAARTVEQERLTREYARLTFLVGMHPSDERFRRERDAVLLRMGERE